MNQRRFAQHCFALLSEGLAGDEPAMLAFCSLFTADAELWLPPTPNTQSPYVGAVAARQLFRELLQPMYPQGLHVRRFNVLKGGTRTAFELQSHGIRSDGSEYVNSPCLCLDVKRGRIRTLWEHWGGPGFFDGEARGSR